MKIRYAFKKCFGIKIIKLALKVPKRPTRFGNKFKVARTVVNDRIVNKPIATPEIPTVVNY